MKWTDSISDVLPSRSPSTPDGCVGAGVAVAVAPGVSVQVGGCVAVAPGDSVAVGVASSPLPPPQPATSKATTASIIIRINPSLFILSPPLLLLATACALS